MKINRKIYIFIVIIGIIGALLGMGLFRWFNYQNNNHYQVCDETNVTGQIVVGFKKEIEAGDAEKLFTDIKLTFNKTDDVNLGKDFFYKTGLKYIVRVTPKQEYFWIDTFSKSPLVAQAGCRPDPTQMTVD